MGWKIAAIVLPAAGRPLQACVDAAFGKPQQLRTCAKTAGNAIYPRLSERFALSFGGFNWIFNWGLVERAFKTPLPFDGTVWTFALHSVTNGYGFALQEGGKIVRARSGAGDNDTIDVEVGEPLHEERSLVATFAAEGQEDESWTAWCNTGVTFDGKYENMTHDGMGEEVVFGLMKAFTGFRIDEESVTVDAFCATPALEVVRAGGILSNLFGRRTK